MQKVVDFRRGGHSLVIMPTDLNALRIRPRDFALFLDIDGTLLDLAETPDGIVVPDGLTDTLRRLSDRMGGALALVTGRRPDWVDARLGHAFPIAGLHGFERRRADGQMLTITTPDGMDVARARLTATGIAVEDKGAAIALHFRQTPELEPQAEAAMTALLAELGPAWVLQRGKKVIELRPAGASKGAAVEAFLQEPPFVGRTPIAIGDDVTDEAMFPVVNALGGLSIRVGEPAETAAQTHIASPAALRAELERIASWAA